MTKITGSGAYANLLEYGKEGLLNAKEITSRRISSINRVLKEEKDEVLKVLKVDSKGFIDLSKKEVKSEEIEQCKARYANSKQVENIVKILSIHTNTSIGTIYKRLIWPLYKTHEHALDALKEILGGNTSILDGLKIKDEVKNELLEIIKERLAPQPIKIRADFKLTCYHFEGIEAIKRALISGEKISTKDIQIKFYILGPPLYECTLSTLNKKEGIALMNKALDEVKKSIKESNGRYELKTAPEVIGGEEKSLSEQLKEANSKGNNDEEEEVEEDEDEEQIGIKPNLSKFDEKEFNINNSE